MDPFNHQRLVQIVRDATVEVCSTMLALEMSEEEAYLDQKSKASPEGVLSFVGMAGSWVGTGALAMSAPFACKLSGNFLMGEYAAVDDEVLDAIGEITNMIIGNVKTKLEEELGPMGLSIPTVIYGRNFTSRTLGSHEWTVVPFTFEGEKLQVQVCIAPARESRSSRPSLVPVAVAT